MIKKTLYASIILTLLNIQSISPSFFKSLVVRDALVFTTTYLAAEATFNKAYDTCDKVSQNKQTTKTSSNKSK